MTKAISIALIVGGVVLLYSGGTSILSVSNDASHVFTGSSTIKTILLIAGGVVALLAGIIGVSIAGKTR